ncbi:hypothetical protein D3C76_1779310 [compost metagenome]
MNVDDRKILIDFVQIFIRVLVLVFPQAFYESPLLLGGIFGQWFDPDLGPLLVPRSLL